MKPEYMLYFAIAIAMAIVAMPIMGCAAADAARPTIPEMEAAAEAGPRDIEAEGDVEATTDVKTDQQKKESAAEVGGQARDVSTVRYGLDPETKALLGRFAGVVEDAATQAGRLLGRVVASVFLVGVGIFLMAFFSNAPGGSRFRSLGVLVGLATMVGGPAFIWTLV